jgi:hypothetical protein
MRAVLAGAALAAFVITPSLADYYIIQGAKHEAMQDC